MNEQKESKITINELLAIKEALGNKPWISQIKVIENAVLPDDCIVVSSKIFEQIKASVSKNPGTKEPKFWGNAI